MGPGRGRGWEQPGGPERPGGGTTESGMKLPENHRGKAKERGSRCNGRSGRTVQRDQGKAVGNEGETLKEGQSALVVTKKARAAESWR